MDDYDGDLPGPFLACPLGHLLGWVCCTWVSHSAEVLWLPLSADLPQVMRTALEVDMSKCLSNLVSAIAVQAKPCGCPLLPDAGGAHLPKNPTGRHVKTLLTLCVSNCYATKALWLPLSA